ncbi:MAG TPA: nitrogenase component 1 [Methanolinea sp.]|nr:nitrogenase component 1 [Methanolinea sp.]HQK55306.1 nitrogenase component 1 [Methanolinea sp.]
MPECAGPLWPCGLTGAAACLSGVQGVGVIIHGSAGCYFYPATTLHSPIYCTSLSDHDIVLGTGDALVRTIDGILGRYSMLAVLCTCTPAIIGEDIRQVIEEHYGASVRIIVLDAPGFAGEYEAGFLSALSSLPLSIDVDQQNSVNIDGLSLMDPFWRGNLQEIQRLLLLAGGESGATLCAGAFSFDSGLSSSTIHANPDLRSGFGTPVGTMIGLSSVKKTVAALEDRFCSNGGVISDQLIPDAEERVISACDKYQRRFDPPTVGLFGQNLSMQAIAAMLTEYLGAEIACIGSRNSPSGGPFPVEMARDFESVSKMLDRERPDLVLGSSFEQAAYPSAAFVGVTAPLRGTVRLHARPLAGIEGTLALMESVLNACMDHQKGAK